MHNSTLKMLEGDISKLRAAILNATSAIQQSSVLFTLFLRTTLTVFQFLNWDLEILAVIKSSHICIAKKSKEIVGMALLKLLMAIMAFGSYNVRIERSIIFNMFLIILIVMKQTNMISRNIFITTSSFLFLQ